MTVKSGQPKGMKRASAFGWVVRAFAAVIVFTAIAVIGAPRLRR